MSAHLYFHRLAIPELGDKFATTLYRFISGNLITRVRLDHLRIPRDFFQMLPNTLESLALWHTGLDTDAENPFYHVMQQPDGQDDTYLEGPLIDLSPLPTLKDEFYCQGLGRDLALLFIAHVISAENPEDGASPRRRGMFGDLKMLNFQFNEDEHSANRSLESHLLESILIQSGEVLETLGIVWYYVPKSDTGEPRALLFRTHSLTHHHRSSFTA